MDNVSFKISANPGEPPKSLIKVASGGEMSRIMLAIKTVIADIDKMPTLIFDEIDTGISGRTAQSVAEKMSLISRKHQLLCVTHLPQIAAMADTHFRIEKITDEEKTSTTVHKLSVDEQFEELSRMLGGAKVTDITREHAKEMIKLAELTKSKI
jgi:DNA repair protein RecN (Recombination protein N)